MVYLDLPHSLPEGCKNLEVKGWLQESEKD